MTLVPKREYVLLLAGDIVVFTAALWLTLLVRYLEVPSYELFLQHLVPFSFLFAAWVVVFFVAGLYGRHTRLFRSRLTSIILYTLTVNVALAALFFFLIPSFGLAPKTILALYLVISFVLVFLWRIILFPHMPRAPKLKGVLIASGKDASALAEEIQNDPHAPFSFEYIVDTSIAPTHEIIQKVCRVAEEDDVTFLVVDFSDQAVSAALPIIYDAAFHKRSFALVEASELYEEIFERVPLSFIDYEWVLSSITASRVYDILKRFIDLLGATIIGFFALLLYPFIMLAIKLDDGGPIFITQERVGRYQRPIRIMKFRSMSGNDEGNYGESGKTQLRVTRVGKFLRASRLDEIPQLWNVFKGDLSLVGPRPELPALANQYSARIPYYNARHLIAPGLMGWAQLKHDRHPHHGADIVETKEKLSFDLYYLEHRSLLLDIFILIQTVRILISARGS
ncbi:exopolysaccharide biosynthesis polyprenyl glycosylphosphotransferase [Candidatus Kaiserbacteria bacterium]|nr:exopolysaccharide biosynthesis polyprenyl glycosylphosphotransferase [Candidatus Kaiserbacteria bacterium]